MAFTYTGGATNGGSSTTASTGTHGITINEGDLVVCYVNINGTSTLTDDDAGWTVGVDSEQPSGETARHRMVWREAGASEPSSYTWTLGSSDSWRVIIKVFSGTSPTVDAAAVTAITGSTTTDLQCSAIDGEVISDDAVSIVFGGKDNRGASEAYTTADNSYTGVSGNKNDQAAAGAHRIYTTGTTFSGNVVIQTADGSDNANDVTYSIHISFVEGAGGTTGTIDQTLSAITQSASGTVQQQVAGTISQTLSAITQSATGTTQQLVTGAVSQTLSPITQSATGTVQDLLTGTISQTLSALSQSATAAITFSGTINQSLSAVSQSAAGTVGDVLTGTISQSLSPISQSLSASLNFQATIAQTLSPISQSLTGVNQQNLTGTITQTLSAITQSATESVQFSGSIAMSLPALTMDLTGFNIINQVLDANRIVYDMADSRVVYDQSDFRVLIDGADERIMYDEADPRTQVD